MKNFACLEKKGRKCHKVVSCTNEQIVQIDITEAMFHHHFDCFKKYVDHYGYFRSLMDNGYINIFDCEPKHWKYMIKKNNFKNLSDDFIFGILKYNTWLRFKCLVKYFIKKNLMGRIKQTNFNRKILIKREYDYKRYCYNSKYLNMVMYKRCWGFEI
jgi:hypothetical protein